MPALVRNAGAQPLRKHFLRLAADCIQGFRRQALKVGGLIPEVHDRHDLHTAAHCVGKHKQCKKTAQRSDCLCSGARACAFDHKAQQRTDKREQQA